MRTHALLVSLISALVWSAQAQPAARDDAPEAGEKVVTRVYDVRDVLMPVNEYPFRGNMMPNRQIEFPPVVARSGGGGGAAQPATGQAPVSSARSAQERIDEVIRLIAETVDPDSWRDAGGTVGSVREIEGQLIVTQTQENHRQLVELLAAMRRTKGKMVRVRAQWLLLPPDGAEALLGAAGGGNGAKRDALPAVDPARLAKLPEGAVRYRAETVCLNNQTVHVISGPARTVVTDVDAQVGTGVAAFDPVMDLSQTGLMLQVKPLVLPEGNVVLLDLHSAYVSASPTAEGVRGRAFMAKEGVAGEGAVPGPVAASSSDVVVDRMEGTMQELRTTVYAPVGRPVLVGGMTLSPDSAKPDAPQLYLVIEVLASEFGGEGGAQ
ncbi:MAG TPA: hypothetical protein VFB66_22780 [Tepidisphaeraceae bacterium]|nr:hypothetical protein [Tepidisphaeraceae bacterium]